MRSGFLLAASEFGDHYIYQVTSLGDSTNQVVSNSTMDRDFLVAFNPRGLKNIAPIDEMKGLGPITKMACVDLIQEGNPQIYLACGRAYQSTLRLIRHGLQVTEVADTSLPDTPTGVWTIKEKYGDDFDKLLLVSFEQNTLVLSIGSKIGEVHDSGFENKTNTILAGLLSDDSMIQVFPEGIIHIKADGKRNKWVAGDTVLKAAANEKQVIVAVKGGDIRYFELDSVGSLVEIGSKIIDSEITCLDVGPIQEGRQRSRFLALGCDDKTVKVLSLDPESCLSRISVQALPTEASDVCLIEMKNNVGTMDMDQTQLFLHIGLSNGVLLRAAVDSITGNLSDSRNRYLGTKPLKLIKVTVQGLPAMLALSSRPWFCYNFMSKYYVAPLSYDALDYASCFSSEQCKEGMVGVTESSLKIFSVDKLGEMFNQVSMPLAYTVRAMEYDMTMSKIITVETDHLAYSIETRKLIRKQIYEATEDEEYNSVPEQQVGYPKAGKGQWASCIRITDPKDLSTHQLLELAGNESAFSMIVTDKLGAGDVTYLVLGSAKDMCLHPKSCVSGYISVYYFDQDHKIRLIHKTPTEDLPMAFGVIGNRLVAGIGNILRIYDLGKKKLLRKCENKSFQSNVNRILVDGSRIFASDQADSIHVLKYKPEECQLYVFADDVIPRWITDFTLLDCDTLVGCDKFENVFVLRLPPGCEEDAEDDPTSTKFQWESGYLSGAAFKFEQIAQYHTGELITSIQKTKLSSIGSEVILYGTTMGSIGALVPFEYKEDIDFFLHLEMYLRLEALPLCGREHVSFRSAYVPVKNIIDGDLCEQFASLDFNKQKVLADELDKHPMEVLKKLEEARNRVIQ